MGERVCRIAGVSIVPGGFDRVAQLGATLVTHHIQYHRPVGDLHGFRNRVVGVGIGDVSEIKSDRMSVVGNRRDQPGGGNGQAGRRGGCDNVNKSQTRVERVNQTDRVGDAFRNRQFCRVGDQFADHTAERARGVEFGAHHRLAGDWAGQGDRGSIREVVGRVIRTCLDGGIVEHGSGVRIGFAGFHSGISHKIVCD